jgi:hypothetical protein
MLRTAPVQRRALFLMALVVALSGCKKEKDDSLPGSGVQAKKTRSVPPFKRVWAGYLLRVSIKVGENGPLELKGDDNLLDHVRSRVENGVLKLDMDTMVRTKMPLEVTLATAELEGVTSVVTAKVTVQGLKARGFEARAAGAASITAQGVAESLTVSGNGATQVDLTEVAAASAVVRVEKAATVRLGYLEKLDVTASGVSSVIYQGEPVIQQNLQKPARLIKKEP